MAIKTTPVLSKPIYLGDLSADVKAMEEGDEPDDLAWVVVRQATEADQQRLSGMSSETRTIFSDGGTEQIQDTNPAELRALQVFRCLTDAGNIYDLDGKTPLFRFDKDGVDMGGFSEFKKAYGRLHPAAAGAIMLAVYKTNPHWDWMVLRRVKCSDCGFEFELTEGVMLPLRARESQEQDSS
jgi:hypothetical protein